MASSASSSASSSGHSLEWSLARFDPSTDSPPSPTPVCGVSVLLLSTLHLADHVLPAVNLLLIFISMGVISHSPPNFDAAVATYGADAASGPVMVNGIIPDQPIFASVNGLFNCIFACESSFLIPSLLLC